MKKILITTLVGVFVFGMANLALAFSGWVNFVLPTFDNVDTTTGWSLDDNTNHLAYSSFTIIGGIGTVTGYYGDNSSDLSHRGTRGLGVWGRENDEIDNRPDNLQESIVMTFSEAQTLDYLELRSLFFPETGVAEHAYIYYYLGATQVGSDHLLGEELPGGIGLKSTSPHLAVDKIVFQVDNPTVLSDFSIAKLGFAVPEPASMLLLGLGILGLFGLRRKT